MLFNANPRKWNLRIRSFAGWYSVWLSNSYNRNISSECACSLSHQPLITNQFRKPEIVTTSEELKTYPEEGPIRFLTQTGETVMGAWGIAGIFWSSKWLFAIPKSPHWRWTIGLRVAYQEVDFALRIWDSDTHKVESGKMDNWVDMQRFIGNHLQSLSRPISVATEFKWRHNLCLVSSFSCTFPEH